METPTKPKTTRPRKNPGPAPAAPGTPARHLTPATEAALLRRAELLGVDPAVVVEIAVAQWLQQQTRPGDPQSDVAADVAPDRVTNPEPVALQGIAGK